MADTTEPEVEPQTTTRYRRRKDAGRIVVVTEFSRPLHDALFARCKDDELPMAAVIRLAVKHYLACTQPTPGVDQQST